MTEVKQKVVKSFFGGRRRREIFAAIERIQIIEQVPAIA
jgi:hypothetical protein